MPGAGLVQRVRLRLGGAVQGVGFRPFVYRLAQRRRGFHVLLDRHLPPSDGGVSFGQVVVAAARLAAGNGGG
jgi:hydrogenase maturation factor HypF (carbamoyltransferase family)